MADGCSGMDSRPYSMLGRISASETVRSGNETSSGASVSAVDDRSAFQTTRWPSGKTAHPLSSSPDNEAVTLVTPSISSPESENLNRPERSWKDTDDSSTSSPSIVIVPFELPGQSQD